MLEIKGNSLYLIKKYILTNYNEEFYLKLIGKCDPSVQKTLKEPILSNRNYPGMAYFGLITAFFKAEGKEELYKMCEFKVNNQLNWLYKTLMAVTPWKMFVTNIQMIWSIHFNEGKAEGRFTGDNSFVLHLSGIEMNDVVGIHLSHYMKIFFEKASGKRIEADHKLIDKTHLDMIYTIGDPIGA